MPPLRSRLERGVVRQEAVSRLARRRRLAFAARPPAAHNAPGVGRTLRAVPTDPLKTLRERTRYEPAEVEARIFARWEAAGIFHPEPPAAGEREGGSTFSIAIPPPNVTG